MLMTMTNLMLFSGKQEISGAVECERQMETARGLGPRHPGGNITLLYETSGGIVSGVVVFCLANNIVKSQVFHMIGQSVYDDGARL